TTRPVDPRPALALVAVYYMALGGIGFALSTVVRFDWVAVTVVWELGQIVRAVYGPSDAAAYAIANVLLPPSHRIDAVSAALFGGRYPAAHDVGWLVAYGAVWFLFGVAALKYRAMAE